MAFNIVEYFLRALENDCSLRYASLRDDDSIKVPQRAAAWLRLVTAAAPGDSKFKYD